MVDEQKQVRRLEVSDVRVIESHGKALDVQFDLDWREAFRDGEHWNAAWVFIKVKPSETVEVESTDAARESLTDSPDAQREPSLKRRLRAEIERGMSALGGLPRPPRPPGFPPGAPPSPRELARRIRDRVDECRAEGAPSQQTDEDASPGHEPELAPEPRAREPSYSERAGVGPVRAFRAARTAPEAR